MNKKITLDFLKYNKIRNLKNENFKNLVKKIKSYLENENGYVVLKNFKIDKKNLIKTEKKYLNFASSLGVPLKQNKKGEKVAKVVDGGKKWSANTRGYTTSDPIPFHTDGGTYASLLCIENSSRGGKSIITESYKIYETLKRKSPKVLKILEKGFKYHTRGESSNNHSQISKKKYPVFFYKNKYLHCMFNKKPMIWALEKIKIKNKKKLFNALNYFEKISNRKKNIIKFKLNPGEMLIYNNYKILHGREQFYDNSSKKRLILRAWIKAKNSKYVGLNLLDAYQNR